jgi:hypothetical protein
VTDTGRLRVGPIDLDLAAVSRSYTNRPESDPSEGTGE